MHDAFDCVAILEKLPLEIECIATAGNKLLVGTNKGHLLVYGIQEDLSSGRSDQRFEVELQRSNKAFGRKPISQLVVEEQYGVLISLCDGMISVHDFDTYSCKTQFPKGKGVNYFAINTSTYSGKDSMRLCTISKRKIQTYVWIKNEFQELHSELGLPETPRTVIWVGTYLCVGTKKEYMLIKADSGHVINLFDTGKKQEPLIVPMPSGEIALCRDEVTVFLSIDTHGQHHQKHAVTWSDVPLDLQFSQPYIIAALSRSIEICSRDPRLLVQRIDITGTRNIVCGPHCYAASITHVWRLVPVLISTQVEQLIKDKEFKLALTLTSSIDNEGVKKKKMHQIKTLYAFELFYMKRFEEALKMFKEVDAEPTYVIGLYPDLLPEEYRKQLDYPSAPPKLSQGDLEKGFVSLTEYLTRIRNKSLSNQASAEIPGTAESRKMLLQIIDTSLLKCYLKTNENMIAPLLRLKDNNCHVEECERVLVKEKKVNELVLLYQSKGIHKKALDLLLRQADLPSSPLKGPKKTIEYLQKLGADYIGLIFDYSKWVLKKTPEEGLKIFTNDIPEIEGLPRQKVLVHLENNAAQLVIKYLEHIIFDWKENRVEFHNKLITCYKEKIMPLLKDYLVSLFDSDIRKKAGKESGELGDLRSRLLFFLETSTSYQPMKLLRFFPQDVLFEERALLLGRAGRHEEALAIYIYVLKDTKMAEQYCRRQHEMNLDENRNVYLSLVKVYLKPNHLPSLGLSQSVFSKCSMKANVGAALTVLNTHYQKIDVSQALDLLPAATEVNDITVFLLNVLKDKMQERRNCLLLKSLLYAEHLQMHEQRVFYQSKKCTITEERACCVCHKRIGTSAFAMYPNDVIVHYYCCKDRRVCPPESFYF